MFVPAERGRGRAPICRYFTRTHAMGTLNASMTNKNACLCGKTEPFYFIFALLLQDSAEKDTQRDCGLKTVFMPCARDLFLRTRIDCVWYWEILYCRFIFLLIFLSRSRNSEQTLSLLSAPCTFMCSRIPGCSVCSITTRFDWGSRRVECTVSRKRELKIRSACTCARVSCVFTCVCVCCICVCGGWTKGTFLPVFTHAHPFSVGGGWA